MKALLLLTIAVLLSKIVFAQNAESASMLVNEGITLNDSGKYAEAIEKYTAALKADPSDLQADYEMGFTLYNSGKSKEAIPYLETILKSSDSKYETYELLGSIYDDDNQPDKAIELYKKGIKEKPGFERLHFNLGLTYLRIKKYDEAEAAEMDAIKLDPRHASSQRIYAMAEFDQGNRICALLAWCSFLLLEPQTERSVGAYDNIRKILNYGIARKDDQHTTLNISTGDIGKTNFAMPLTILAATEGKKGLSSMDSLSLQLTALFKQTVDFEESRKQPFFGKFYAQFFYKLAQSDNMPAFVRLISLTSHQDQNLVWFKQNAKQLDALDEWVRATGRDF